MTYLRKTIRVLKTDRTYRILLHYHIFIPVKTPLKIVAFEGDIFKFKYAFTALTDFLGAKSLNIYEDLKMMNLT